jgi:D-arabinose 1-dehydrogenase-like Zn-dependent alcohol dehydrogenase
LGAGAQLCAYLSLSLSSLIFFRTWLAFLPNHCNFMLERDANAMKAVVASATGDYAEVLSLRNVPKPELLPGTALVRVLSAGLAFPDVLVVEGKHMMRRDPPFTPGQEICGQVFAIGEGVTTVAVGQQVFGPCVSGGLAEFALVDAGECFSAPRAMDPHTAAGFELNYGTSWHGLVDLAGLRASETLLVLGASGGIGLSAIAIARARRARVVAAASSDARLDACRQAGAHVALSYAGGGKALKAALAEAGVYGEVDVVLDPVGGELSEVPPPPAALCNRGCNPMQSRLQPCAAEAAPSCIEAARLQHRVLEAATRCMPTRCMPSLPKVTSPSS